MRKGSLSGITSGELNANSVGCKYSRVEKIEHLSKQNKVNSLGNNKANTITNNPTKSVLEAHINQATSMSWTWERIRLIKD